MPSPELFVRGEENAYKTGKQAERTSWKTEVAWILERVDERSPQAEALKTLLTRMGMK